ncbi:hypothetical protein [Heyndrickxia coagulans]|uniref:hypothetical protein n=1 Tax=Heyndrickxia coagulans TaxID=1398 RepID=UPI0015C68ABC|nr:hypothetical protein [Heyndrickxia coagulans]MDT9755038.1 hypothetical protein [Heyndrickxia coagulans]MEC5269382.1 hypothetical protein [Heyndrickxia coagulans]
MEKENGRVEPTLATGLDDQEELDQKATLEEIAKGEYTKVVRLSLDEADPSKGED